MGSPYNSIIAYGLELFLLHGYPNYFYLFIPHAYTLTIFPSLTYYLFI
jgi:hypothetical protein